MTNSWVQPLTGMTVGGYHLQKCIGEGAFGLVFEATAVDTGTRFALKVLPPSSHPGSQIDFDNERHLLTKLIDCSSVINLIDSGLQSIPVTLSSGLSVPLDVRYHVLSLASGTLEDLVVSPAVLTRLAWPERIKLWRGAVKGVHQMHLKSVAHRDLKSSNCLIMVSNSQSEVRLADLGRSKDFNHSPLHPPEVYLSGLGDFRYAPPEQLWLQGGSSEADFRNADLYGLGSLLVELSTGHPMTALAFTSWADARRTGVEDRRAGVTRDLATLRPQFKAAIDSISDELPRAIRLQGVRLVTQLCDPVPHARQPQRAPGRRYAPDGGLLWLLHRVDILDRQLAVAPRRPMYRKLTKERSA